MIYNMLETFSGKFEVVLLFGNTDKKFCLEILKMGRQNRATQND